MATPEQVRAALNAGHVRYMVVFCDSCFTELAADLIVRDQAEGLRAIRAYAVREHGWTSTPQQDLCPACRASKPTPSAKLPAKD